MHDEGFRITSPRRKGPMVYGYSKGAMGYSYFKSAMGYSYSKGTMGYMFPGCSYSNQPTSKCTIYLFCSVMCCCLLRATRANAWASTHRHHPAHLLFLLLILHYLPSPSQAIHITHKTGQDLPPRQMAPNWSASWGVALSETFGPAPTQGPHGKHA